MLIASCTVIPYFFSWHGFIFTLMCEINCSSSYILMAENLLRNCFHCWKRPLTRSKTTCEGGERGIFWEFSWHTFLSSWPRIRHLLRGMADLQLQSIYLIYLFFSIQTLSILSLANLSLGTSSDSRYKGLDTLLEWNITNFPWAHIAKIYPVSEQKDGLMMDR